MIFHPKNNDSKTAQCYDKPEIIVVGKNKQEIKSELDKIIAGYVEAFPESKFFTKDIMHKVVFI